MTRASRAVHFVRQRLNPRGIIAPLTLLAGAGCAGYLVLVLADYGPFDLLYFSCLAMTFGGGLFAHWLAELSPAIGTVAFCWLCSVPTCVNFIYDASRGHSWSHGFFFYYLGIGLLFVYVTPRHALVYSIFVLLSSMVVSLVGRDIGPLIVLPAVTVVEYAVALGVYDRFFEQRDLNRRLLLDNEKMKGEFIRVAAHIIEAAGDDP